ncbi:hypothetical protein AOCH_006515 [Aspergillus ochraceoroseus]|uniref:Uncharacterized protein n=1 Tax=Aspergillus ochraceoroseus TaxID=138278 RepID=A0A0F8TZY2_9EURO|nr:hypothetical protein AOCH_006515 [Aspergillus ochraceoroseus]
MDYRPSDRLCSHLDAYRRPSPFSSSSYPRQRWSQLNPSFSSSSSSSSPSASSSAVPITETAGPSQQLHPCRHETALDEPTLAYRTTALRQLNGNPKPLSWKSRQAASHPPTSSRSSTLASQPVLVRAYSGGPDDTSNSSKMPSRRSFPFTSSSNFQEREYQLPSHEEFSIDGILRAIEPDIRSTLDSIGEICGRSKLSLANEYGSHIAPLGEIRAPPAGLLPVDEASSDHGGYSGDNLVIYDDDNSAFDGRDPSPFSHYTFFDTLIPSPSARDGSSIHAQPATPRTLGGVVEPTLGSLPTTREFASKPKADGRALLGNQAESLTDDRVQYMLTPALVSEILLDAQANVRLLNPESLPSTHPDLLSPGTVDGDFPNISNRQCPPDDPNKLSEVQSLFRWLKQAAWHDGSGLGQQQTAEMRLRAMLERLEAHKN